MRRGIRSRLGVGTAAGWWRGVARKGLIWIVLIRLFLPSGRR